MEKLNVINLRVAQNVPESVCKSGLYLEKRLKRHLIDLFETVPIQIRKILNLKLPNKIFIGFGKEELSESTICINSEDLLIKFLFDKFFYQVIINNSVVPQTFDNDCFLLSLGNLDVKKGVHFVDVQLYRLGVMNRILVQVELRFSNEILRFQELGFQKVQEDLVRTDDIRKTGFGIDYNMVEEHLYFTLEIFFGQLLDVF